MSNSAFTPTFAQNLQDASATQSGLVNTSAQTIAGNKTFSGTTTLTGDFVPLSSQMFRNKILNPGFAIAQRGTTINQPADLAYTLDRWFVQYDGGAATRRVQQISLNTDNPVLPGTNYRPSVYMRLDQYGAAGGTYNIISTKVEDVRTFSGKTVTLSFWANTNIPSLSVTPTIVQWFNNGGTGVTETTGATQTVVTGALNKYTVTMTLPSVAGKQINANSNLEIRFKLPTTGTWVFDVAYVQLEEGSASTVIEERPLGLELMLCQRYFEKSYNVDVVPGTAPADGTFIFSGTSEDTSIIVPYIKFAVVKALTPTITFYNAHNGTIDQVRYKRFGVAITAITAISSIAVGTQSFVPRIPVGAAYVPALAEFHWTAAAELPNT